MRFPIEWCIDQIKRLKTLIGPSPSDTYIHRSGGNPNGKMTGPLLLAANPVDPLEAVTKQYVDSGDSNHVEFVFSSPVNPWPLPHNKGRYPSSVRILVKLPSSPDLQEFRCQVNDIDLNNSIVIVGANYEGRAELIF